MSLIGENIARLRKERGWSQDALADRAGTTQTTIEKIEKGQTRRSRFFMDIAKALDVTLATLDPELGRADADIIIPRGDLVSGRDLPVYASTEGGEGIIVISSEPIDFVKRPAPLWHVKEGYGVIVVGDSMVPAFRPGDIALVHPLIPPRIEDTCVFQGDGTHERLSTLKEYVGQSKLQWRVKRYRPEEIEFSLNKRDWPTCHVVVGKYSRR